jgi:hypothetical protein
MMPFSPRFTLRPDWFHDRMPATWAALSFGEAVTHCPCFDLSTHLLAMNRPQPPHLPGKTSNIEPVLHLHPLEDKSWA